jgi:hypothetical protein
VLSIETTNQRKYDAWKATPKGEWFIGEVLRRARAARDAGERRVCIKEIAHNIRGERKTEVNNTLVSFVARDIVARDPSLDRLIERRERRAS